MKAHRPFRPEWVDRMKARKRRVAMNMVREIQRLRFGSLLHEKAAMARLWGMW